MKARYQKWLVSLMVIVCLFLNAVPCFSSGEGYYGVFFDISFVIEPDYTVAYQYVESRDGYLWKPDIEEGWEPSYEGELPTGDYWVPLGLWGSLDGKSISQIRTEMEALGEEGFSGNSMAVIFSWGDIEGVDNHCSWGVYDAFLRELRDLNMKVFVIIDLNSFPLWFPEESKSLYAPRAEIDPLTGDLVYEAAQISESISFTDSESVELIEEYIIDFVSRYAVGGECDDLAPVIAGWIIDVGDGYIEEDNSAYIGYEDSSVESFSDWLAVKYSSVDFLNEVWQDDNEALPGYLPNFSNLDLDLDGEVDGYADFDEIDMPVPFIYSDEDDETGQFVARDMASWYDLMQWREQNFAEWIGGIVEKIYEADNLHSREGDKDHLISVLTEGQEEGDSDWQYACIDEAKIVQVCNDYNLPLDFWSIVSDASSEEDNEAISAQWQLIKKKALTDLPVMVLRLGVVTDPDTPIETQESILKTNIWSFMYAGALGVQVDDSEDAIDVDGLSYNVIDEVADFVNSLSIDITDEFGGLLEELGFMEFLLDSEFALPEVGFLQTDAMDTIFNRGEAEIYSLYGALKRLGFQPGFIKEYDFVSGDYIYDDEYSAVVLARNQKMSDDVYNEFQNITASGTKLHVSSDLPGLMDEYGNPRHEPQDESVPESGWSDWRYEIEGIFGIDPNNSGIDTNLEDGIYVDGYESSSVSVALLAKSLECPLLEYSDSPLMWKYRDELSVTYADLLAVFPNDVPALTINNNEAAIALFSMGDNGNWGFVERTQFLELIYKNTNYGFGLNPVIEITGSPYIWMDYRAGPEDTWLLYVYNYNQGEEQSFQLASETESFSFIGKKVTSLTSGVVLSEYCVDSFIEIENLGSGEGEFLLINRAPPVNIAPVAYFDVSESEIYIGNDISFDASESYDEDGSIVSYSWNFGDGNTDSGVTTTHTYSETGVFEAELTVTDDDGETNSTQTVITVSEVPNIAPVAIFTTPESTVNVDVEIEFDASESYDEDGTIDSYLWNFGDGNIGEGVKFSHAYSDSGTYIVKLTVTDDDGALGYAQLSITVEEQTDEQEDENVAPIATFTNSESTVSINVEVTFDASGSYDKDGTIYSYTWDFGDGSVRDGATVSHLFGDLVDGVTASHSYSVPGTFDVKLTVTDDDGTQSYAQLSITVEEEADEEEADEEEQTDEQDTDTGGDSSSDSSTTDGTSSQASSSYQTSSSSTTAGSTESGNSYTMGGPSSVIILGPSAGNSTTSTSQNLTQGSTSISRGPYKRVTRGSGAGSTVIGGDSPGLVAQAGAAAGGSASPRSRYKSTTDVVSPTSTYTAGSKMNLSYPVKPKEEEEEIVPEMDVENIEKISTDDVQVVKNILGTVNEVVGVVQVEDPEIKNSKPETQTSTLGSFIKNAADYILKNLIFGLFRIGDK